MLSQFLRSSIKYSLEFIGMKKITLSIWPVLAIVVLMVSSCSRPTPVGAELLEQDKANVAFTDTLSLIAKTVPVDSVRTYSSLNDLQLSVYLCGDFNDPVFGNTDASIYTQFRFNNTPPNFTDVTLDSIVLLLQYDTVGFYGDTLTPQNLEIYRISETMDSSSTYFSNKTFAFDGTPLGGAYNFAPKPSSQVQLISGTDTSNVNPHLRIRLDDALGTELIDTALYSSEARFLEQFHGLHIRSTSPTNTMMGFRLLGTLSRMTIFYTKDTLAGSYSFPVTDRGVKFTNYEHDYSSTNIPAFFNDTSMGDSLMFIQGMSGSDIDIDIPGASSFNNIIVNKAELEFTVATLAGDDENLYPPPTRIILTERNDEGDLLVIDDVIFSLSAFGGQVEESVDNLGKTIRTYRLNISSHFQDLVDGVADKPLTLLIFGKQEVPTRAVLYGPGHSQYPAKINLAYTILN